MQAPKFTPVTSAIRALAMDAVQKANSGHPGAPMGMAEIAAEIKDLEQQIQGWMNGLMP